jgi:hypothetical protein
MRQLVDCLFEAEQVLGRGRPAKRDRRLRVGQHAPDLGAHRIGTVQAQAVARAGGVDRHQRRRPGLAGDLLVDEAQPAVTRSAEPDAPLGRRAVVAGDELLAPRHEQPHRRAQLARQHGSDRVVRLDVDLAAEAAADEGTDHAHRVERVLQGGRQALADHVRALVRIPQREPLSIPLRDATVRLEAVVVLRRRAVAGLEHDVGLRLCTGQVTALDDLDAAGDVALGRQARRAVGQRLPQRDAGVVLPIRHLDRTRGVACLCLAVGHQHADLLADERHVAGDHRAAAALQRRPGQVIGAPDAAHAGQRARRRGIEANDAAARHGGTQQHRMQHPRPHHVGCEAGRAGDLGQRRGARQRASHHLQRNVFAPARQRLGCRRRGLSVRQRERLHRGCSDRRHSGTGCR